MAESSLPISETIIHKKPTYENDSLFFSMSGVDLKSLDKEMFRKWFFDDASHPGSSLQYQFFLKKCEMFETMSIDPKFFSDFESDIPSLHGTSNKLGLDKTNYRVALREMASDIFSQIREMRDKKSRRLVLNFANPIGQYHDSHYSYAKKDISCLTSIMIYEPEGISPELNTKVSVVYRASDLRFDFLVDFYCILKYVLHHDLFIDDIDLDWYSATCQNKKYTQWVTNFFHTISKKSFEKIQAECHK